MNTWRPLNSNSAVSMQFCNDYRKLNEVSEFDAYPMPRVDDLIPDSSGHAGFLTTLAPEPTVQGKHGLCQPGGVLPVYQAHV